ncbi:TRAP transporter small permease subunit [Aquibium oceanicum]|uniref:TRAP transporter small permease protein n=1 Tax=Aquibium oceanicum TaxID=1670800 RepID=A0A1L3SNU7_9HYPH|nr:TRAP transporter small permease [Aquibium oceanicum]APH71074.1 TRAP transporter small permease protein [Aquibium oceanicum]
MATAANGEGAATERRRTSAFMRMWSRAVDGLAALGTLMIVLLMTMIFCDVLARNLIGGSLPLVSELGALTLVMIVFLQLGTTVRNDRLARTDFFFAMLEGRSPRTSAFVAGVWDLFGIAVCAGIAWSTWGILWKDYEHAEYIGVTGVATVQTWPFRALILVGVTVAALQFVIQAARSFARAAVPGDPAP